MEPNHLPVHDATETNPSSYVFQKDPNSGALILPHTHTHTHTSRAVPRRRVGLGQAVGSPIRQTALPVARHGGGQAWGAPHQGVNLFAPGHGELKREGLLCPVRPGPPCHLELWKPAVAPGCRTLSNGEFPSDTHTHTQSYTSHPLPRRHQSGQQVLSIESSPYHNCSGPNVWESVCLWIWDW